MHHMVAHQRDFGYDVIYHLKDHYLGSHIFVNLYQINCYLVLETIMQFLCNFTLFCLILFMYVVDTFILLILFSNDVFGWGRI